MTILSSPPVPLLSNLPPSLPPALNTSLVSAYFYFCFLLGLLTDRATRDDDRCFNKYGADWKKYRDVTPNKILPKFW